VKPVDRALVERLLEDETVSFREVSRRAGCSDWSVRAIARDLAGGDRRMKREVPAGAGEPIGFVDWLIFFGFVAIFGGALWFVVRRAPLDGGPM